MSKLSELTIGIIGGQGKMGRRLTELFKQDGIEVITSDIETQLTNLELVEQVDIVIIAVPIDKTIEIIDSITPHLKTDQLLMDITSVKKEPTKAMLKSKADVIGMHPMFGPTVKQWKKQTVILTQLRDKHGWLDILVSYFKQNDVKIKITSPETHDRIMSLIQVLVHFNTIAIGVTMSKMGFDIYETLEFTSPIYRMELATIGRIFSQSSRLYGNIPMYNPYTLEILLEHKLTIEQMSKLILTKDMEGFQAIFKQGSSFFDDFKEKAMMESDFIISEMVKLDKQIDQ